MKKYVLVMIFFISVFIGLRFNNNYHSEIKVADNDDQCWTEDGGQNQWLGCCTDGTNKEMISQATTGLTSCPDGMHQLPNLSDCCDDCNPDNPVVEEACYSATTTSGTKIYKWGNYYGVPGYTKEESIPHGQCNSLIIKKVDSQNKNTLLSGATITITGPNYSRNATIGSVALYNLVPGNYTIVETVAPTGYENNNTSIGLFVNPDGEISVSGESVSATNNLTLSIKNTKMEEPACYKKLTAPGGIVEYVWGKYEGDSNYTLVENKQQSECNRLYIKKVDENGTEKTGAKVTITKNGTSIYTGVIPYTQEFLESGEYYIKETVAPTGYILDQTEIKVTVSNTGEITVSNASNLYEKSTTPTINAYLSIKNKLEEVPACYQEKTGDGEIAKYVWGKYEGNSNYTLVANTQEAQCNVLTILKVDEKGAFLTGAKIKITGPNNYNETKGIGFGFSLSKLSPGTYKLKEIEAPTGYKLNQTEITVTVSSTGTMTIANASNLYNRSTSATRSAYLSIKNEKEEACYYNSSTGEYDWTNSPKTGYKIVQGVSSVNYCKDVCYYDNNKKEYIWQRKSEITIPELVEITQINSKDKCQPFCYYSSKDDDYKWDALPPSDDYKVVDSIDVETNCVKKEVEACYKNISTGKYVWGKYEKDSAYSLVSGVNQDECHEPITEVPKTDFDVSKIIYIAVAFLAVAGTGFILYSYCFKKKD